jgi:MSHA pilin protein MshC
MSTRSRTSALGFTLIELLTTLVIVGILSVVAIPRFFDDQAFGERGYVDEVAFALRYARKVAVATECEVAVTLTANSYSASQRDTLNNCNNAGAAWATPVRRADGSNVFGNAPAGVALAPDTTIVFRGDGQPAGIPPALSAGVFTITVDPTTGRVTVAP